MASVHQGRILKLISESQTESLWLKLRRFSSSSLEDEAAIRGQHRRRRPLRSEEEEDDDYSSQQQQQQERPPEPIPNRPLRPQRNPKFQSQFQNNKTRTWGNDVNPNPSENNSNFDFLEKFKLGPETPSSSSPKPQQQQDQVEEANNAETPPPQDAEEIFKKLKETGLIPNAVAMLDGLCKDGLVQDAMKLFGLMREKGTIPEVVIYTAVVDGFCKAHKFDDAQRVFKKMQNNAGHSPNVQTFVGLVTRLCLKMGVEEARKAITTLTNKGFFVNKKAIKEYMDKKSAHPLVWEAIFGNQTPEIPFQH
nr:pentatricopeptide repeat-containing protein [Quercus suber]